MRDRCPACFARIDATHSALGRCPGQPLVRKTTREPRSQRGYVPPSRSSRVPRAEYLEAVSVPREQKLAQHRENQRRYRERRAVRGE